MLSYACCSSQDDSTFTSGCKRQAGSNWTLIEEAQESRNKDVKNFREHFTKKYSRKVTNEDVMRRLLCSSDPFITSMRRSSESKKELALPKECLDLLL